MNDTDVLCFVVLFFFFCNFVRTDSRLRPSEVVVGGGGGGGEREEGGANINIDD